MRKYQYYNENDDSARDAYGVNWIAQTFKAEQDFLIASVKLKLYKIGSPGEIKVSIRATQNDKPIGGDLCSGVIDGNTITADTNGEWYEITLGDGYNADAGATYAIVVRAVNGSSGNEVDWRADGSSPTYANGLFCNSSDSGTSWNTFSGVDALFEVWGVGPPSAQTVTWGNLPKSQISSEKIEEAVNRITGDHNNNPNAHLGKGQSLKSHKAAEIIDHLTKSIIAEKIDMSGQVAGCVVAKSGGDYSDIQSAIDAGEKRIYVKAGTYTLTENIVIPSNIVITGENEENTIIDLNNQYQITTTSPGPGLDPYSGGTIAVTYTSTTVVGTGTLWASRLTEGGFIIFKQGAYKIASITDDTHLELEQMFLGDTESGISYEAGVYNENITFKNFSLINQEDDPGYYQSLLLHRVINSKIENIKAEKCQAGMARAIRAEFLHFSKLHNIDIKDYGYYAISLETSNNNILNKLKFSKVWYRTLDMYNSHRNIISNSVFTLGGTILLLDSNYNTIANSIINQGGGIDLDGQGNLIKGNNMKGNGNAVVIRDDYNIISTNTIEETNGAAIYIDTSNHNIIKGNTIKDSSQDSDNTYNAINISAPGVNAYYNIISDNNINETATNKAKYGIYIEDYGNYSLIHGNIVQNAATQNIKDDSLASTVADNIT